MVRGELGKDNLMPTFNVNTANTHYSQYSMPHMTNFSNMEWFKPISIGPEDPNFKPFNMSPIRPKDISDVLNKSNHKSSPGPDGIPFGILYNLPSSHHILATLFNKDIAASKKNKELLQKIKNKLMYCKKSSK